MRPHERAAPVVETAGPAARSRRRIQRQPRETTFGWGQCATCAEEKLESATPAPRIQRAADPSSAGHACTTCDSPEAPAEREADRAAESSGPMSMRESAAGGEPSPGLRSVLNSHAGRGDPLPDTVRETLEPRFDADLSDVRVHADGEAHRMATGLGATAFTYGSDIYFRGGAYDPAGHEGRKTLAHEVAHAVQQTATAPAVQREGEDDGARARAYETTARKYAGSTERAVLEAHGYADRFDPASTAGWDWMERHAEPLRFERTLAGATGRELELRSEITEATPGHELENRLTVLLRMRALSMMAQHRSYVAELRQQHVGYDRAPEERAEVFEQARVATGELRGLRSLRFQAAHRERLLDRSGRDLFHTMDPERPALWDALGRIVRFGTEPYASDATRNYLRETLFPELRRRPRPTTGRLQYLGIAAAAQLARDRHAQLGPLEAAAAQVLQDFPFLAMGSSSDIGVGESSFTTRLALSDREGVGPGEAIDIERSSYGPSLDELSDASLDRRMLTMYAELTRHIDRAIARIGSGGINPLALPLVVQGLRAELPPELQRALDDMAATHRMVEFWVPLAMTAAQAAITFIPVVGPALGFGIGLFTTGMQMRDLLDRYALSQASIAEDRSMLGVDRPTGTDWILAGVDAILTAFDLGEVIAALHGGSSATRLVGELDDIGEVAGRTERAAGTVHGDDVVDEAGGPSRLVEVDEASDIAARTEGSAAGDVGHAVDAPPDPAVLAREMDEVRSRAPRPSREPGYDVEVAVEGGAVWRRREGTDVWCHFRSPPDFCGVLVDPAPGLGRGARSELEVVAPVPSLAERNAFRRSDGARRGSASWTGADEARYRGLPNPPGDDYEWILRGDGRLEIRVAPGEGHRGLPARRPVFDSRGALTGFETGFDEPVELARTIDGPVRGVADPAAAARWDVPSRLRRRLRRHFEAREEARRLRDAAMSRGRVALGHTHMGAVSRASEDIGEVAAAAWVSTHFPGARRVRGIRRGPGVLDQIWELPSGEFLVVEAKGGAGVLGSRRVGELRYQQGRLEYLRDVVTSMVDEFPDVEGVGRLETALDQNRVRYFEVRTPISGPSAADLDTVLAREFDIRPDT